MDGDGSCQSSMPHQSSLYPDLPHCTKSVSEQSRQGQKTAERAVAGRGGDRAVAGREGDRKSRVGNLKGQP